MINEELCYDNLAKKYGEMGFGVFSSKVDQCKSCLIQNAKTPGDFIKLFYDYFDNAINKFVEKNKGKLRLTEQSKKAVAVINEVYSGLKTNKIDKNDLGIRTICENCKAHSYHLNQNKKVSLSRNIDDATRKRVEEFFNHYILFAKYLIVLTDEDSPIQGAKLLNSLSENNQKKHIDKALTNLCKNYVVDVKKYKEIFSEGYIHYGDATIYDLNNLVKELKVEETNNSFLKFLI